MNFEQLPDPIEEGVRRFASDHNLSHDDAIVRLIQTGLNASGTPLKKPKGIPCLSSEPLGTEDSKIVDEALELVMEARRERSERIFGA